MKLLIAPTEGFIKSEVGKLAASVAPGSNVVVTLENNNGYAVNDYIALGIEGSETAELQRITTITGNTQITLAVVKFAHRDDEPIIKYRYNQRKFYGSLTASGSYSHLVASGSPKDIQVDDPQGTLLEYAGGEGYLYFKSTYFNSTTSEETSTDDAVAVLADDSKRYTTLESIKTQAGLSRNPYISDALVETYRKRAENEVNSIIGGEYALPLAEVPAIIENATTLLAAGYMDYKEFGGDGEGVKWLGEARGLLNSIVKGTQKLIGSDGKELDKSSTGNTSDGISMYPDSDFADDHPPIFRVRDKY